MRRPPALDRLVNWRIDALFLQISALILTIALPVGMVFAHRGSAAIVASSGLALLIAYLIRFWPTVWPILPPLRDAWWAHPVFALFALFFLLAAISLPFTAMPRFHGWRLIEFASPVVVTGAMLFILRRMPLPISGLALLFGLTIGAALSLYELRHGSPLRAFFGFRVEDWRLNRTMVVLLLLIFPYLLLATQNTRRHQGIALAAGGIALPAIAILHSQSGAAEFGLIMGVITFILALCFWQLAWWGSAVAAVGTIMSAPWLGSLLFGLIPDHMHEKLRSMSTAIRIDIWRAFGSAVSESPILGAGFNVAASFDREPAFRAIPDQLKGLVEFGHAHSAALQIWVEFGLVGALIAAILALLTLRQIDRAPERLRPVMLAAFNACFVIAVVSHGAWQAWWAGAIGGLILLFFLIAERERRLLIT